MSVTQPTTPAPSPLQPLTVRRQLLSFNILWAIVLGGLGYFIGHWLGTRIGNHIDAQKLSDQDDIAIFLGLIGATIGWLIGLGFLNYPLSRMAGRPAGLHERHNEVGPWRYFKLSTDHKVVAMQYFVAVLFFF